MNYYIIASIDIGNGELGETWLIQASSCPSQEYLIKMFQPDEYTKLEVMERTPIKLVVHNGVFAEI